MNNMAGQEPSMSKLLDTYMNESGIGNAILARKLGISRHTIRRWRIGEIKRPNCDKILEMATVLKLTPSQHADFLQAAGCETKPKSNLIPVIGKPIISPNQFFGCEKTLNRIQLAWHKISIENVAVIGPRSSGKTSFLHYLNNIATMARKELRPDQPKGWTRGWYPEGFQFAMIDFQKNSMLQPEPMVRSVLEQLNMTVPESCNLTGLVDLFKQLDKPTIILMDNIEKGLKAPALDATFWHNMRSDSGMYSNLGLLVTACEPIEQLAKNEGKSSPFFNLFGHVVELSPFTSKEADEFLSYFPENLSLEDKNWIVEKSHCWPVLLQILCDQRLLVVKNNQSETVWKTKALKRIEPFQSLVKSVYSTVADYQKRSTRGSLENRSPKQNRMVSTSTKIKVAKKTRKYKS